MKNFVTICCMLGILLAAATNAEAALFSVDFRNPTIISDGITLTTGTGFEYNDVYGNSWRMRNPGVSFFTGTFYLEFITDLELTVIHLSSAHTPCPGGGYSPIDVVINDSDSNPFNETDLLLDNYDVAENHGGSHGYVMDTFTVPAAMLRLEWNTIAFAFEDNPWACSHYWIMEMSAAVPVIPVAIDVKPQSCPNPLNLKSKGIMPVAVLGREDFDVNAIDLASIRLEGVAPIRSSLEDVGAPPADGNECECTEEGPDGFMDLTLKFKTQQIVEQLGSVLGDATYGTSADPNVLVLTLTGSLSDGRPIEGSDCVVLVGKIPEALFAKPADINEDGAVNLDDLFLLKKHFGKSAVRED